MVIFIYLYGCFDFRLIDNNVLSHIGNSHNSINTDEQSSSSSSSSSSSLISHDLYLFIYAPLLGLVYIYEMTYGPCVKIIPVGIHCQLLQLHRKSKYTVEDKSRNNGGSSTSSIMRYDILKLIYQHVVIIMSFVLVTFFYRKD